MSEYILHPIPPLYDENARILILGSFPSVKSREAAFFYGHPQNRFWPVMAALLDAPVPQTVEEKTALVTAHGIAMWDVIAACSIEGSADSSIADVKVNDLSPILRSGNIRQIFVNGQTAAKLYKKYTQPQTGMPAICLPSTSPANAAWSLARLTDAWSVVKEYLA